MKSFIWINTVVICSISWISVSVAHSQIVNVQPGHSVTLWSPILTKNTVTTWSRLTNKTTASCICFITSFKGNAEFCDGFSNEKFEMKDNNSGVYLTIKKVDLSDSRIYFCEFFNSGKSTYYVTHLYVNGSEETQDDLDTKSQTECNKTDKTTYVMSLILGGLTVFLLMVVTGVIVSLGKRQAASSEKQDPQLHENVDCDNLTAAALSVFSPAVRSRRPASQRQVETHVTYAASR
ncbi:uncharacterized protein LOC114850187 isoform X3 [Betta splendens]|uniref:Uncharacterized protein LOC114850187 isoform X3 n=1 Tax=Betta splendens TaxID=158456 RepID=A0A9W2XMF5_BETSP|nr:uncharacterized protein LOC114850187 isoform X3 [Betta splendens]